MMAVARTLLQAGGSDRDLYLFDTYEGMTPPTAEDGDLEGRSRLAALDATRRGRVLVLRGDRGRRRTGVAGYPAERVHFVEGKVEETVPGHVARRDRAAAPGHRLVRVDEARAGAPLSAAAIRAAC